MTGNVSKPKIDLHMHTTLSDGKLTPTELVRLLAERLPFLGLWLDGKLTACLSPVSLPRGRVSLLPMAYS